MSDKEKIKNLYQRILEEKESNAILQRRVKGKKKRLHMWTNGKSLAYNKILKLFEKEFPYLKEGE